MGFIPFLNSGTQKHHYKNISHVKRSISLETRTQRHIVLWTFNTDDIKPGPGLGPGQALGSLCHL